MLPTVMALLLLQYRNCRIASVLQHHFPFSSFAGKSKLTTREKINDDEDDYDENKKKSNGSNGRFQLYKSKGQHLLTNPRILDAIVRKAGVLPTDTVLEIGPGTGNLTVKLLQSAKKVVAVEIDRRMVDALTERVEQIGLQERLTVITENALKTEFPEFDICVANIPYGISSPLIGKLLFGSSVMQFRSATLLLQKDFARRLLALPGDSDFNRLAANVGLLATVELLMDVSKRDFIPCPKVDSSLVMIEPRSEIPAVDLDEWLAFTRTCFTKKNKTLGAIFKQKKNIMELFERSKLNAHEDKIKSGEKVVQEADVAYVNLDEVANDIDEEDIGIPPELSQFKEKIIGLLKSEGFEERRP